MGLNPSNLIAEQITGDKVFPNLAGREGADEVCAKELEAAGITAHNFEWLREGSGEVKTGVMGEIGPWGFRRAWYYWVAKGPGIPPAIAKELHDKHGKAVRVEGHCGCPDPLEYCKGFAVGMYHVDTQAGLKALAETIKGILEAKT